MPMSDMSDFGGIKTLGNKSKEAYQQILVLRNALYCGHELRVKNVEIIMRIYFIHICS